MTSLYGKIREIASRLLKAGTVEMVIGFAKGTVPMMNEPISPEDAGPC
jgi:formate dehydrogenase (coenzyme F420) beta subunit